MTRLYLVSIILVLTNYKPVSDKIKSRKSERKDNIINKSIMFIQTVNISADIKLFRTSILELR